MTEKEFVERLASKGGKAYIAGGYVRDKIMGRHPHDKDYVVAGISEEDFLDLFEGTDINPERRTSFETFCKRVSGQLKKVGGSFPVYLMDIDGKTCEVAFARKERKTGDGYTGFSVEFDKSTTIEKDLFRRDTTINSMALELPSERLIDPYNGRMDIGIHLIRATSKHFLEDPVRALRAARQSAELGFTIESETLKQMGKCKEELKKEPLERIFKEMEKALKSRRPSTFFNNLLFAELLDDLFPELFILLDKEQPRDYHPEGNVYNHSMIVLDLVSYKTNSPETRFAALVHDIGKGKTPDDMIPHHYQHDKFGLEVMDEWNKRMTLPNSWMKTAKFVIKNHMKAAKVEHPGKMVDLLMELDSKNLSVHEFSIIIEADSGFLPEYLKYGDSLINLMKCIDGRKAPESLKGEEIGNWIRQARIEIFREFFRVKNSLKDDGLMPYELEESITEILISEFQDRFLKDGSKKFLIGKEDSEDFSEFTSPAEAKIFSAIDQLAKENYAQEYET